MWWGGSRPELLSPHASFSHVLTLSTSPTANFPFIKRITIETHHNGPDLDQNSHPGACRGPGDHCRVLDSKSRENYELQPHFHDGGSAADCKKSCIWDEFSCQLTNSLVTLKDFPVIPTPSENPFVFCAVLLFSGAAFDLILLSCIPYHEALDEALPYIRPMRNSNLPAEDLQVLAKLPEYITKSLTMYWNVWISIAACRFILYGGIAAFIYQSRDSYVASSYTSAASVSGFDLLKHRVVFTFAFMEMMSWFWVS